MVHLFNYEYFKKFFTSVTLTWAKLLSGLGAQVLRTENLRSQQNFKISPSVQT